MWSGFIVTWKNKKYFEYSIANMKGWYNHILTPSNMSYISTSQASYGLYNEGILKRSDGTITRFLCTNIIYWTWSSRNISFLNNEVITRPPGGHLNIKMPSHQGRNSHCKDRMVSWPPYLIMGIPIAGNWNGVQDSCHRDFFITDRKWD